MRATAKKGSTKSQTFVNRNLNEPGVGCSKLPATAHAVPGLHCNRTDLFGGFRVLGFAMLRPLTSSMQKLPPCPQNYENHD